MKILANRNTIQGLLTYYVSLAIFVGSCISVWTSGTALSYILFGLSLCSIIIQEAGWIRRSRVHPQDRSLVEALTTVMEERRTDLFLKERDFAEYTYDERELEPLMEIRDWQGVDKNFVREQYQHRLNLMRQELSALLDILLSKYSMGGMGFYHLVREGKHLEDGDGIEARQENAVEANRLARQIYSHYQWFRKCYLTRMQAAKQTTEG